MRRYQKIIFQTNLMSLPLTMSLRARRACLRAEALRRASVAISYFTGLRSLFRAERGISGFASALPRNRSAPRNDNLSITFVSAITSIFILVGITLMAPVVVCGQSQRGTSLSQESRRDPFLLPSGVRLLSRVDAASGTKGIPVRAEGKRNDIPGPLKVKAILIGDRVRLALIDRHIVTVGDSIHDEKVLEIKADRVFLGKGNQKRTLLLSQSPVLLTVEERKGEQR